MIKVISMLEDLVHLSYSRYDHDIDKENVIARSLGEAIGKLTKLESFEFNWQCY